MTYNTGIGSRHTVYYPAPESELWLDAYTVSFSRDETRNSYLAMVSIASYPRRGGYSAETIAVYNMPDESAETSYRALAEALKESGRKWRIRKLWYAPKNRNLRRKLKEYGWHDQGR